MDSFVYLQNANEILSTMTTEFVYSIENIFSDGPGSVFHFTKTTMYYIGPYQRSYKWKSRNDYDQVPQLLNDINEAFDNKLPEYFLQYITVKADNSNKWIEVIDGQQRLTTLAIIFYLLGQTDSKYNIAANKLNYSRYDNGNIFDKVCDMCYNTPPDDDKAIEEQDLYYMVTAARRIKDEIAKWGSDKIDYLLHKVKFIVNIESNFVSSEEIFANLNDNHVPLTDAYLIKGLLLTNAVNRTNSYGRSLEYSEIQEKRKILGRMWDEMQTWIIQNRHCHFFFKSPNANTGMEYLLEMALCHKYGDTFVGDYGPDKYLNLFNRYNSKIKDTAEAIEMIAAIKHIYKKMKTIYGGILYNLWGFIQFSVPTKNKASLNIYAFIDKSETELLHYLKDEAIKRIPDLSIPEFSANNYEKLRYKSYNPYLTNLLLSFSVFIPWKNEREFRFRFYDYEISDWSFEHISPQNPKDSITVPDYARTFVLNHVDKQIKEGTNESATIELKELRERIANGEKIDTADIEFLFDSGIDEHSLGNMALLSRKDNSANNNNPFMVKKLIIQKRKGLGAFIPNHTYEVFNKILVSPDAEKPFSAESIIWNKEDVEAHIRWMEQANSEIINWINNLNI